jgi:prepilin-type processing-associated H-X9-DG protein
VFAKAREKARQTACLNNQKQIATAVLMYAQDNDELLPAPENVWGSLSLDKGVLVCPTKGTKTANGYVFDWGIAGAALGEISLPTETLLTVDGNSASTGLPNMAYDYSQFDARHGGKCIASFADGHVEITADTDVYCTYLRSDTPVLQRLRLSKLGGTARNSDANLADFTAQTYLAGLGYKNMLCADDNGSHPTVAADIRLIGTAPSWLSGTPTMTINSGNNYQWSHNYPIWWKTSSGQARWPGVVAPQGSTNVGNETIRVTSKATSTITKKVLVLVSCWNQPASYQLQSISYSGSSIGTLAGNSWVFPSATTTVNAYQMTVPFLPNTPVDFRFSGVAGSGDGMIGVWMSFAD